MRKQRNWDDFIPEVGNDGIVVSERMRSQAIMNGLYYNNMVSKKDKKEFGRLVTRVARLDETRLIEYLYCKLKYLGFEASNEDFRENDGFQKRICTLCRNFQYYYEHLTEEVHEWFLNQVGKYESMIE